MATPTRQNVMKRQLGVTVTPAHRVLAGILKTRSGFNHLPWPDFEPKERPTHSSLHGSSSLRERNVSPLPFPPLFPDCYTATLLRQPHPRERGVA